MARDSEQIAGAIAEFRAACARRNLFEISIAEVREYLVHRIEAEKAAILRDAFGTFSPREAYEALRMLQDETGSTKNAVNPQDTRQDTGEPSLPERGRSDVVGVEPSRGVVGGEGDVLQRVDRRRDRARNRNSARLAQEVDIRKEHGA